jgi:dihydrofolate reductase
VAMAANNAIGRNNGLLCHLPGDLQRFKQLTLHHTVIMGYRTFQSLPKGALPLRKNIVLSRTDRKLNNCVVVGSLEEALAQCKNEEKVFIIGGGTLYCQTLAFAQNLYLTHIHAEIEGDTFFPEINYQEWTETHREDIPANEKCPYPYSFVDYVRKDRHN